MSGGYGHESDSRLFANSDFKKAVEQGLFNLPEMGTIANTNLISNYFFVGDAGFPLENWLMKPFVGTDLSVEKRIFNYRSDRLLILKSLKFIE